MFSLKAVFGVAVAAIAVVYFKPDAYDNLRFRRSPISLPYTLDDAIKAGAAFTHNDAIALRWTTSLVSSDDKNYAVVYLVDLDKNTRQYMLSAYMASGKIDVGLQFVDVNGCNRCKLELEVWIGAKLAADLFVPELGRAALGYLETAVFSVSPGTWSSTASLTKATASSATTSGTAATTTSTASGTALGGIKQGATYSTGDQVTVNWSFKPYNVPIGGVCPIQGYYYLVNVDTQARRLQAIADMCTLSGVVPLKNVWPEGCPRCMFEVNMFWGKGGLPASLAGSLSSAKFTVLGQGGVLAGGSGSGSGGSGGSGSGGSGSGGSGSGGSGSGGSTGSGTGGQGGASGTTTTTKTTTTRTPTPTPTNAASNVQAMTMPIVVIGAVAALM
jgi:hypothetical protein